METIVTKTATLSYIEQDILLVKIIEYSDIEVEDAEENFQATLKLTEGRKYGVVIDARVHVQVSSEARIYGASKECQKNLIAQAIVVTSLANKLIGNFIIRFNKPYAPTQLFSNIEDALVWVRELIKKNNSSSSKKQNPTP